MKRSTEQGASTMTATLRHSGASAQDIRCCDIEFPTAELNILGCFFKRLYW